MPETYISDEITRLDVYKRVAEISGPEELSDVQDELTDRFGDMPKEALNLLDISLIRSLAAGAGITQVVLQQNKIVFAFAEENILSAPLLAALMDAYSPRLTIYAGVCPRISLSIRKALPHKEALDFLQKMTDSAKETAN